MSLDMTCKRFEFVRMSFKGSRLWYLQTKPTVTKTTQTTENQTNPALSPFMTFGQETEQG